MRVIEGDKKVCFEVLVPVIHAEVSHVRVQVRCTAQGIEVKPVGRKSWDMAQAWDTLTNHLSGDEIDGLPKACQVREATPATVTCEPAEECKITATEQSA